MIKEASMPPETVNVVADPKGLIQLSGNAPLEIFPFVTIFHREVVLRHHDDESQDIEMTPDEADAVAELLKASAAQARAATNG
jgi:hypothetical protein